MLKHLKSELQNLQNPQKAKILASFFKTKKGQYGYGDVFLGIVVPVQRKVAKKFLDLNLKQLQELLNSKIHEYRLTALFILIDQYQKADLVKKKELVKFYLNNTDNINNWDLVDISAPKILGDYLLDKDRKILFKLAKSKKLWERRIAIVATFALIRKNQFIETLKIAEILLKDQHDLIHKAVGWMLREVGKRDVVVLENFLQQHCKTMPRVMLRYAIERLGEEKRKFYLKSE